MDCPNCCKKTQHYHKHDTAYGHKDTHVADTEHYECAECGYIMRKDEAESQGLKFIYDLIAMGDEG